jgi:periplasmic protein TonB
MFDSVGRETRLGTMTYLASLMMSLVVHVAVLCTVFILPLIFFNALNQGELLTFLLEPPPPPPAAPALRPPVSVAATLSPRVFHTDPNIPPAILPKGVPPPSDEEPAVFGLEHLLPEGDAVKGFPGPSSVIPSLIPKEPPKLPTPLPPKDKREQVKMSGYVLASKLIYKVDPVYPNLARISRISGTVILEASIDEEGNVAELKVLSGHPFLTEAAITAVKQWKYTPTILNGEPVSVLATITVHFRFR